MAKEKDRIKLFDRAATELAEMVLEYENILPDQHRGITDRLNATVAEIKAIVECLVQCGVPDEDILEAIVPACDHF